MTSTDISAGTSDNSDASGGIVYERSAFGVTSAGEPVERWTLDDGTLRVSVLTYGGNIQKLEVPAGPDGQERVDVVLGFDDIAGYEGTKAYISALIGRVANRLTNSTFTLDGTEYKITANEAPNSLHGGVDGFNRRIWAAEPIEGGLRLSLTSPDGDQGYPGELTVTVDYLLLPGGTFRIRYDATTSAPTLINLTQHAYFNLGGVNGTPSIDGQTLQVASGHYTPVDQALLPSGEIAHVVGTPMDLRTPQPLDFLSLDHNLVLDEQEETEAGHGHGHGHTATEAHDDLPARHFAAKLRHEASGRTLTVSTSEPAIQVYTGSKLDGSDTGKGGVVYGASAGVCLETQNFPDAPNHEDFPSIVLRPGEQYLTVTDWAFSV
ncbi:aldose epimerase family protein [Kineosporia sp. NBRC 101731]|uniref:aldose epimerase family protein n=1 Tax=Kineosporia sp. NBRC 101731 TaxID=3032199 RepID=UPI0024A59771|nr:aldose epimerase family protein [Kineosporia sp. NBRC 101731]GLY27335.1 aldose 1-epimerase [Kineosporia sp. NBRC 101731]